MNFLQIKTQNRKLAKEFESEYKLTKFNELKQVEILRSKIDDNVLVHFVSNLDITENEGNKEYECVFYHKGESLFEVIVPYEIKHGQLFLDDKHIGLTDLNGNAYSIENENLIIKTKNYNFNKSSLSEDIEEYLGYELKDL